jgi:hypothetical protein
VLDGNNDNQIEYLTTVVGALILYLLPALGRFQFATTGGSASDPARLLQLVAINALPEMFIDFFCILTETEGGLGPVHLHYWRKMSPLSVLIKASRTIGSSAFVIGACLVTQ